MQENNPSTFFTHPGPYFNAPFPSYAILAILGLVAFLVAYVGTRLSLRISIKSAALLCLIGLGASAAVFSDLYTELHRNGTMVPFFRILLVSLLPMLAIPFAAKLYLKWTGQTLTDAEKAPGLAGVQAWLSASNLIPALLISVLAWVGFDWSFWASLLVMALVVLAYPVLNMGSGAAQAAAPKTEDLSPERERVLKMLEDGKISAEESAELLNALSHSAQPRPSRQMTTSPHRKLVLIGVALLVAGFFLPWFSINLGNEMNRVAGQMEHSMNQLAPGQLNLSFGGMPNLSTGSVNVMGGDIQHGLGWWVLLLGVAAALLPYFATNLDPQTMWKAALAGLGLGAVILVYLLTNSIRFVSVGIILVLAGYVLQFIGTLRERPLVAR